MAASPAPKATSESMAVNCEKVISDLFAAWTRLNLEDVMSYFAEDAVWDNVPMSPAKGKQAIREMTHGFMKDMSAFSVKILKSLHEGNVVFDSRVDTITMKSGKKAEVPVAGMFELDDAGKIKVWRDYFDLATFTRQDHVNVVTPGSYEHGTTTQNKRTN
jgi:limonene-1,2-epoxide hydrolase